MNMNVTSSRISYIFSVQKVHWYVLFKPFLQDFIYLLICSLVMCFLLCRDSGIVFLDRFQQGHNWSTEQQEYKMMISSSLNLNVF